MGLFGSRTVTQVGTSVSRVIEDEMLTESMRDGLMKSIIQSDEQIVENMLEGLIEGMGSRAGRMHSYAKKSYPHGLPIGRGYSTASGKALVQTVLEGLEPSPVSIEYYHYGPLNNLHVGWKKLVEEYNYDSEFNTIQSLSTLKGKPVFLKDMVVVVTEASLVELENGSLDQWGIAPTAGPTPERKYSYAVGKLAKDSPFMVDSNASEDYIRVEYVWEEQVSVVIENVTISRTEIKTETMTISLEDFDPLGDYFQVKYFVGGKAKFWTYLDNSGVYSNLDALYNEGYTPGGNFFPITYFRYNKVAADSNKQSAEYKSSKKMLTYLGIDYQDLIENIHKNPDIADVEQAMMVFAVPAVTDNQSERRYLFDFFNNIHKEMKTKPELGFDESNELRGLNLALQKESSNHSIMIQDARFRMALSYETIIKSKKVGKIAEVGEYYSGFGVDTITGNGVEVVTGNSVPWITTRNRHFYCRQVSEQIYEQVEVFGLKMSYYIFENFMTVGDENDDILLIPIDQTITKTYAMPVREELYARSMHYVFNSRVVTKLKWYQTGIFKVVLIIASIVMALYSYGTSLKALGTALAAGGAAAAIAIKTILMGILKFLLLQVAFKLFVKAVGAKVALIVALVAAAAGMAAEFDVGPLSGTPWGTNLLSLSSGLTKAINTELKNDYSDLLKDQSDFSKYVEEQTKLLDKTKDLLKQDVYLSPFIIFGETPNQYYERTVHSGNIGVIGIDAVTAFVETALTLPKLNETVGA